MATDLSNEKKAQEVLNHVEALLEAEKSGRRLDSLTAEWLTRIGSNLTARLANVGLIVVRNESNDDAKLGLFIAAYIKTRTDVKGRTSTIYSHAERNLVKYFGSDHALASIKAGDADEFGLWLRRKTRKAKDRQRPRLVVAPKRQSNSSARPFAKASSRRTRSTDSVESSS